MFDEEMITKYRYIILLIGTAVSFVLGFVVANWGVDTAEIPVETALPMETLFKDVAGRDFTITDKNSEVYTNGIGDPHWIK